MYIISKLKKKHSFKEFRVFLIVLYIEQWDIMGIRLCVALKSEFFIGKKHLKPRNKRNRDNLFDLINYVLANQVTIMKKLYTISTVSQTACRERD